MNRPLEVQFGHPFDYDGLRHLGSHLLRRCALCGCELEYLGETITEAKNRERNEDPWQEGDGADCTPTRKYESRDALLDADDHDRCQC